MPDICSHTVHELVDAGEHVVVLDNLSTGFLATLPEPAVVIVGDAGDQPPVAALIDTQTLTVNSLLNNDAEFALPSSSFRQPMPSRLWGEAATFDSLACSRAQLIKLKCMSLSA